MSALVICWNPKLREKFNFMGHFLRYRLSSVNKYFDLVTVAAVHNWITRTGHPVNVASNPMGLS